MRGGVISVVVVSYNTRRMTLDCLEQLHENIAGMSVEVFVVDNGSVDGSAAAISSAFPAVTVITNPRNLGFGAANNQAMKRAVGEFILLLNSDAFPRPGAIAGLMIYLLAHPRAALVGPRLLNADGSLQRSCHRVASPWRATCDQLLLSAAMPSNKFFGDYRNWAHDQDRSVEMVIGACMLVRREAIAHVGMFDEDFFLYAEEADWCRRFANAGWTIDFTASAEVVHMNGASGKQQSDRVFTEFHRGQERIVRKYHGMLGVMWYRTMVVCGAAIRISLFYLGGLSIPSRRQALFKNAGNWSRLLRWTLGRRGPGLERLTSSFSVHIRND